MREMRAEHVLCEEHLLENDIDLSRDLENGFISFMVVRKESNRDAR